LLVAFTTQTIPDTLQKKQVPDLDALYIIITEDAKIAEIKENQEKLLAYGVNLIFEEVQYNDEHKIEVLKTIMHVDKTFGSANWTKEKQEFKAIILYKNWRNQSLGTGFSEELLNIVENRPKNSKVFVIGGENTAQTIAQLKVAAQKAKENLLAKQQKLQTDPEWKGEWFKETTNFSECSTHLLEKLKMEFLNSTKTTYIFRVNGIEWDETALEIPAESIGAYSVTDEGYALLNEQGLPSRERRKVSKRAINIIRKAQPTLKEKSDDVNLEEIYIILTEEASLKEIRITQDKLLEMGIKLSINAIKYNEKGDRIESISVTYNADGNAGTATWENSKSYNFITFSWDTKTGNTSIGMSDIREIKRSEKNSQLFIIGRANNSQTIDFLERKMRDNQQLAKTKLKELAKDPNWKGYEGNASSTYTYITPNTIEEIKEKIRSTKPQRVLYKVDGIEWGAEALEMPIEKIKQISLFERNRTKFNEQEEIEWEITEQLEVIISRKAQKAKAKKGYQYFKECDCYVPETFTPNGKNIFKIEGGNITESSSFQVYNKWGKKVFDATPFNNHWNGEDNYGAALKEATYFFTFQTQEGEAVVQGYFIIIDKKHEDSTGFLHQPETVHYIVNLCATANISIIRGFVKPELFMRGLANQKRFSSIHLDENTDQSLLILRKFDNLAEAEQIVNLLNGLKDKPAGVTFLSINQHNYRQVLRLKSLMEYQKFYQEEISK
ncbi:MAG: gliding motility-associated C-terminal domain-containing protein, partial [Saprospiraceae bacterium]